MNAQNSRLAEGINKNMFSENLTVVGAAAGAFGGLGKGFYEVAIAGGKELYNHCKKKKENTEQIGRNA